MIGDNPKTDIQFAQQNHMKSILTLTGGTQSAEECGADFIVTRLDSLIDAI